MAPQVVPSKKAAINSSEVREPCGSDIQLTRRFDRIDLFAFYHSNVRSSLEIKGLSKIKFLTQSVDSSEVVSERLTRWTRSENRFPWFCKELISKFTFTSLAHGKGLRNRSNVRSSLEIKGLS